MYSLYIFIAGLTGTTIMTLFLYFLGKASGNNFNVIWLLGSVFLYRKTTSTILRISVGSFFHYLTGIIYSFLFYSIWSESEVDPNFLYSLLFGVITGIIAMIVWYFLLKNKKFNTPIKYYIFSNFIAHIIFAIVVFYVYLFLVRYPLPFYQSLKLC